MTSYCLDDISMIQVVHQHSTFSSNSRIFFSIQTKEKKLIFSLLFFPLHFFLQLFFPSNFLRINWSLREMVSLIGLHIALYPATPTPFPSKTTKKKKVASWIWIYLQSQTKKKQQSLVLGIQNKSEQNICFCDQFCYITDPFLG